MVKHPNLHVRQTWIWTNTSTLQSSEKDLLIFTLHKSCKCNFDSFFPLCGWPMSSMSVNRRCFPVSCQVDSFSSESPASISWGRQHDLGQIRYTKWSFQVTRGFWTSNRIWMIMQKLSCGVAATKREKSCKPPTLLLNLTSASRHHKSSGKFVQGRCALPPGNFPANTWSPEGL